MFHWVLEDPTLAMQFNTEVREWYMKKPFRIDNHTKHNISFLSQLVAVARSAGAFGKRGDAREMLLAKWEKVICKNWNLGKCEELPCHGRHWHGECSECRERHRAADIARCLAKLRGQRQRVFSDCDATQGPPPVVGIGGRKD
jgi:hypothetical protein